MAFHELSYRKHSEHFEADLTDSKRVATSETWFDKHTADRDVAVHGDAEGDPDFVGGSDRVIYSVDVRDAPGPYEVTAELWYQPIAYRWAMNLKRYDAMETNRFVGYYEQTAAGSGVMLAHAATTK